MGSEKVVALGLYLKFVYIRYIPTLEYSWFPKTLLCKANMYVRTICFKAKGHILPWCNSCGD